MLLLPNETALQKENNLEHFNLIFVLSLTVFPYERKAQLEALAAIAVSMARS